jgi:hypothetical protein
MILLKGNTPIGAGEDRVVFQDPTDEQRCIKISRIDFQKEFRPIGFNEILYWIFRGGQTKYFDFNYVDVVSAELLEKNETEDTFKHLPRCYGYVDTDLGKGVAWDLIKNPDGAPCKSLRDYKMKSKSPDSLLKKRLWEALEEFFQWQQSANIMLRELAFINTLVQEKADGNFKLYHIDAIGCADLIPIAKYCDSIRHLRVMNKIYRFRKRVEMWIGKPE